MTEDHKTFPPLGGAVNGDVTNQLDKDGQTQALRLFQSELELVSIIANRIARTIGPFVDREELLAAGREGLFDAARRFDSTRGVPFNAYANIRVQGAIMDSVRQSARLPRRAHERLRTMEAAAITSAASSDYVYSNVPRTAELCDLEDRFFAEMASLTTATATAVSVPSIAGEPCEPNADTDVVNPEDAAARAEMCKMVHDAMSILDPDELRIVKMHYFEDKSLREAARELKVTQSWAVRLHARSIERLTRQMHP